jgi:hypothetical protein
MKNTPDRIDLKHAVLAVAASLTLAGVAVYGIVEHTKEAIKEVQKPRPRLPPDMFEQAGLKVLITRTGEKLYPHVDDPTQK